MYDTAEFKSTVEISRKWDGIEISKELTEKIKNKDLNPRFIALFSTIHYKNEFEKILDGLKKEFPDTPLIGGTVAGFMTQEGCYTRGTVILTIDNPEMDVTIGIGHNTKKNPEKAAKELSDMLKKNMNDLEYSNKFLFILPSGGKVPSLTGTGTKRIYKSRMPSGMLSNLLKTSLKLYQKGLGREDKILDELSKEMPDFGIIGGSSIDDNKMEDNFQFFNDKVFSNSIVGLSLRMNVSILLDTQVAVERTEKIFNAKTAGEKYIISKIDDKPATKTFFEYLNWPEALLDERLYRRTFFYPILFEKDGEIFPEVIGAIFGNSIICGFDVKSNNLCIGQSSRRILNNVLKKTLSNILIKGTPKLSIIIYCSALLETLGKDFFKVQEILKETYGSSPFLLIATGGEDFCIPNKITKHSNETINTAAFSK